jgi:hypothetical protein
MQLVEAAEQLAMAAIQQLSIFSDDHIEPLASASVQLCQFIPGEVSYCLLKYT